MKKYRGDGLLKNIRSEEGIRNFLAGGAKSAKEIATFKRTKNFISSNQLIANARYKALQILKNANIDLNLKGYELDTALDYLITGKGRIQLPYNAGIGFTYNDIGLNAQDYSNITKLITSAWKVNLKGRKFSSSAEANTNLIDTMSVHGITKTFTDMPTYDEFINFKLKGDEIKGSLVLPEKFRYDKMRSGDWTLFTDVSKVKYLSRMAETASRYERALRKEGLESLSIAYDKYHDELQYVKQLLRSGNYNSQDLDNMAVTLIKYLNSKTLSVKGVREREADIADRLSTMPEELRTFYLKAYDISNKNYNDFTNDEKKRFWEIYNKTVEYLETDYKKAYDSNSIQALTLEMFNKFGSDMSVEDVAMNLVMEI